MTKFLAMLFITVILWLNLYLHFTLGWGMEVKSWSAVVGFGVIGSMVGYVLFDYVYKSED